MAILIERGLDPSREAPKPLTDETAGTADVVVTMGCGDTCPVYPGTRHLDWELEDPAGQTIEQRPTDRRRDRQAGASAPRRTHPPSMMTHVLTRASPSGNSILQSNGTNCLRSGGRLVRWLTSRNGGFPVAEGFRFTSSPERAGHGSFTVAVTDIGEQAAARKAAGVDSPSANRTGQMEIIMIKDLDGNSIAFAHPVSR